MPGVWLNLAAELQCTTLDDGLNVFTIDANINFHASDVG
jgi:hypothetical protein